MGEGLRRQDVHHHRHVGRHALLTPHAITDGELQLVPGEAGTGKESLERGTEAEDKSEDELANLYRAGDR